MEQVLEVPGIADIVVETWGQNFKCCLQEHDFVCFYEVIIRCWSKFHYLLIFFSSLKLYKIVATVSCQLLELFKSKESFKETVDSEHNWKIAWPRIVLGWHLFLAWLSDSSASENGIFFWHELYKETLIWHDFMFFKSANQTLLCDIRVRYRPRI